MSNHKVNIPQNMLLYPRVGVVKRVDDQQRMGRLWVWIPEFTSIEDDEQGWIVCDYCSPFAGSTSRDDTIAESIEDFESTQQSYGFWAVPPDIGNEVIIIFPNGHLKNAMWIGALYKEFANKMVPGVPADANNFVDNGKELPVAEYNKHQKTIIDPINITRPGHTTRIDGISNQGLIGDPIRGITTSSAQRESPSEVFGMLTPGPRSLKSGKRTGGSSFVMDDAEGSEHITLMTKSGAKIRIDETNELIYIINKPGTAWIQLDKDGNVDVFGAKSISMRAQGDLDLRADGDINIEAGNNINMKAAKDAEAGEIVGEGNGSGGNVNIEANVNVEILAASGNVRSTAANGDVISFAKKNIKTTSELDTLITSDTAIIAQAKSDIRVTSTEESFTLFAAKNLKGSAGADLAFTSVGSMGFTSSTLDIVSAGFQLDAKGSINNLGDILTVGKCSAANYSALIDLNSLFEHTHIIETGSSAGDTKANEGGIAAAISAIPTSSIPVVLANIDPAEPASAIEQIARLNILVDFEDDRKYKRKSAIISTIVNRFMTFEPCPEHEEFRLKENAIITGSSVPGNPLTTVMAKVSNAATPTLTLDKVREALVLDLNLNKSVGKVVKDALNSEGNDG